MKFKSLAIVLLSIAFFIANSHIAPAAPSQGRASTTRASLQAAHEGRSLRANLLAEGFETSRQSVRPTGLSLAGHTVSANKQLSYELELASRGGKTTGTYQVTDLVRGKKVTQVFALDVMQATADRVQFRLSDKATGETRLYDSTRPQESIAFAIPIGIAVISVGTLLYYLAIGAAIIVAGYIALEAAKAVPKLMEEWNRRRQWRHYTATRSGSKLFIGKHLTSAQAQARGRSGKDVWSVSASYAKSLAKVLNRSGVPVWHAPHGAGYLYHYHPYRHAPNMHSFYGR